MDRENYSEPMDIAPPDDDVIDMTPDGQKIDYYSNDGVPLIEKLLKKTTLERNDKTVGEEVPGILFRIFRSFRRIFS